MQDRFKFRGIHPVLIELQEIKFIDFIHNTVDFGDGDIFNIEDVKIQPCTGLKDKNGKLIYEGDIVEAKHKPDREGWYCVYCGIAKYDNKKCQYVINSSHHKVLNENKLIKSLNTYTSFNCFDWFEVIGNIYENPELLEVENEYRTKRTINRKN